MRFGTAATGNLYNSILWDDALAAAGLDMLQVATYGSVTGTCNDVLGVLPPGTNISVDPLFVNIGLTEFFPSEPQVVDVCDLGGAPPFDLLGVARPFGADYDMGAFEQ